MVVKAKRWYGSRRNVVIFCVIGTLCLLYYIRLHYSLQSEHVKHMSRRSSIKEYNSKKIQASPTHIKGKGRPTKFFEIRSSIKESLEKKLEETLKLDKGMGCEIPQLDPFAPELTQFDKQLPKIECHGQNWVKCYHSKCRIVDVIKASVTNISCVYEDILYHNDQNYTIGPPTTVTGAHEYKLVASDHVKVSCTGRQSGEPVVWSNNTLGFRPVHPSPPPAGREDTFNVLMFGFDTTARTHFIRRMPKSSQTLKELGFTFMEGYNIVGDATPAAMFPILTGKTELELPDVRKSKHNNRSIDSLPFIFYKLKQDGYRTAYFEDMPHEGTFQYRFNGFRHQPADHYLRSFHLYEKSSPYWWTGQRRYCVGDTPQFRLIMNLTHQFMELDGKRFIFTFISDITHDDLNLIETADDDMAAFLRSAMRWADDTLIVIFGDHGPRFAKVRNTFQGKLQERLPLLAIRLPSRLTRSRPAALRALRDNVRALTAPHDLHATILDVLDMTQHQNPYRVRGADLKRGLTMLEPIPRKRSCSEAGIEPHWCTCLKWQNVSNNDPIYQRTGQALIDYINSLFNQVKSLCIPRTLTSIEWVLRQRFNKKLITFASAKDSLGYPAHFNTAPNITSENYQIKIVVGPGRGIYEASMTYVVKEDKFVINTRDISRTNAYGDEPSCISASHPHLNPYCYCR